MNYHIENLKSVAETNQLFTFERRKAKCAQAATEPIQHPGPGRHLQVGTLGDDCIVRGGVSARGNADGICGVFCRGGS